MKGFLRAWANLLLRKESHPDFPMEVTERFQMKDDDQTLEYEFHIKGLANEHGFVLQFKAAEPSS